MPLSARDRLGRYEILSPIGVGGMGEVWKACDTRLDRTVALKTLREFNERFEREARAIAALNHPHICQLYDVGPNHLVMEFVEGSSLTGSMPVQINTNSTGIQIDIDPFNPSYGLLGMILHGIGQVLPNRILDLTPTHSRPAERWSGEV
jgi:serine/threonine protein kinase